MYLLPEKPKSKYTKKPRMGDVENWNLLENSKIRYMFSSISALSKKELNKILRTNRQYSYEFT